MKLLIIILVIVVALVFLRGILSTLGLDKSHYMSIEKAFNKSVEKTRKDDARVRRLSETSEALYVLFNKFKVTSYDDSTIISGDYKAKRIRGLLSRSKPPETLRLLFGIFGDLQLNHKHVHVMTMGLSVVTLTSLLLLGIISKKFILIVCSPLGFFVAEVTIKFLVNTAIEDEDNIINLEVADIWERLYHFYSHPDNLNVRLDIPAKDCIPYVGEASAIMLSGLVTDISSTNNVEQAIENLCNSYRCTNVVKMCYILNLISTGMTRGNLSAIMSDFSQELDVERNIQLNADIEKRSRYCNKVINSLYFIVLGFILIYIAYLCQSAKNIFL